MSTVLYYIADLLNNSDIQIILKTRFILISEQNIPYITFAPFSNSDVVKQAFSTRLGGVSTGMFESMNLTFNPVGQYEADSYKNVYKNFERMASVLYIPVERMVYTTHNQYKDC